PDALRLRLVVEGEAVALDHGETLEHRRALDMRRGALWRVWRHRTPAGRITRIRERRLASLADRRVLRPGGGVGPENCGGRLVVEGEAVALDHGETLEHRRALDMRRGVLWRVWRHRTPAGRITRIRERRLASLADRHVLLQVVELVPENYGGRIELESRIDVAVPVQPLAVPPPALTPVPDASGAASPARLALRAEGTGAVVAFAVDSSLDADGRRLAPQIEASGSSVVERWSFTAEI